MKNTSFSGHYFMLAYLYLFWFSMFKVSAQEMAENYRKAAMIKTSMEQNIYYAPRSFRWSADGEKFWYGYQTPKGKAFVLVDTHAPTRGQAFDQHALAKSLSFELKATVDPYRLPFDEFNYLKHDSIIEFTAYDEVWQFDRFTYRCVQRRGLSGRQRSQQGGAPIGNGVISPDGKWIAFIENSNVSVRSLTDSVVFQLSFDGSPGAYYEPNLQWSPDAKKLAARKVRPGETHLVYLIESSPTDQLQPKLHSRNYLKPGDVLPHYTPALFDMEKKRQVPVHGVSIVSQFNLTEPLWCANSQYYTIEYNQRGHQLYQIIQVDAQTGAMKTIVSETSKTFIDYRGKRFRYDAGGGKEIIWASERDGWNHLYLYDAVTGTVKNQITKGQWVVRGVVHVDEQERSIIFEASGMVTGSDPYLKGYYRINFDGSGLLELTPEHANHHAYFSPDFSRFVDTYSRIDSPPVTVLRNSADGKVVLKLEEADIGALVGAGWQMPEVFSTTGRDDSTSIWGIIVRPSNFDPTRRYPVIEYIYGGPHNSFVPKSFISEPASGDYRPWTALHELAELGFIVVQIDGMGTSNRSKAFHDVSWKNLKDAGFPDRIRWIKAAASQYPYMDTTRVGIYGNSAGGQNSVAALLFHPEFYKVAVSSSGCHDNRMDKLGWNELWMGYPVGPQYSASSNVDNAHRLKGHLLLILGEMDTNVPPESTLQLVDALIKAGKNFDFLLVPGMGHSLGGDYGERKRRDFFVKHLLGIEPPVWAGMND
ncbi:S9 family peptidase [Parapedobacter koreensis]|uniref:Dipeptidyl aminopeptidase/acylaminoacyl peptidase n=1 Tax=Parapedobacter koreensis TaxID=332977 RepID=A0A1H7GFA4_9SPHI|nr:S9 family peptidase [Parapedobacter koreensis]SEK34485.1 Dipeptidyl aminopeptidase/acylaminoacyl peptidase [Parapedobacter koreensis]